MENRFHIGKIFKGLGKAAKIAAKVAPIAATVLEEENKFSFKKLGKILGKVVKIGSTVVPLLLEEEENLDLSSLFGTQISGVIDSINKILEAFSKAGQSILTAPVDAITSLLVPGSKGVISSLLKSEEKNLDMETIMKIVDCIKEAFDVVSKFLPQEDETEEEKEENKIKIGKLLKKGLGIYIKGKDAQLWEEQNKIKIGKIISTGIKTYQTGHKLGLWEE